MALFQISGLIEFKVPENSFFSIFLEMKLAKIVLVLWDCSIAIREVIPWQWNLRFLGVSQSFQFVYNVY